MTGFVMEKETSGTPTRIAEAIPVRALAQAVPFVME